MAWQNRYVVAQWEEFLFNSVEQLWGIASGEIPSSHAAGKENVATDQELLGAQEKAKATGTMARNIEHLEFFAEKIALVRFLDEKVGCHRFDFEAEPEIPKKIGIGNHRRGIRVTTYWTIEFSLNFRDITDVIDVSVGQDQQLQIDPAILQPCATTFWRVE